MEKKANWYDDAYSAHKLKSGQYTLPPEQSMYSKSWNKAIEWINDDERIADYGCGPGQFSELLISKGKKFVYGMDFSSVAIEMAKVRNPNYECFFHVNDLMDESSYNFIYYDIITIMEVLEHLENDKFIFKNIPKGKRIIFSVPNYMCISHVRCFKTPEEIHTRYKDLIKITNISKIKMSSGGKCIWLCDSVKL